MLLLQADFESGVSHCLAVMLVQQVELQLLALRQLRHVLKDALLQHSYVQLLQSTEHGDLNQQTQYIVHVGRIFCIFYVVLQMQVCLYNNILLTHTKRDIVNIECRIIL